MDRDDPVPAFVEVAEWQRRPGRLWQIVAADKWRDGGPRGGTVLVILMDADASTFSLTIHSAFAAFERAVDAAFG